MTDQTSTELSAAGVPQDDELLVVGTPEPDPHIQEALATGRFDLLAEMAILLRAEACAIEMRAPHQSLDDHPTLRGRTQYV